MKEKVVLVNTHSLSNFLPSVHVEEGVKELPYSGGWHIRLAQQIAKTTDRFDLECWSIERQLENKLTIEDDNVLYRFFPARYVGSKRINLGEISWSLLSELRAEVKKQKSLVHLHSAFSWITIVTSLLIKKTPILVQCYEDRSILQLFLDTRGSKRYTYLGSYLFKGFIFENVLKRKLVDCFFVLSKSTQPYFSRLVGEERVQISPMGVDFSVYRKMDKNRARGKVGLDPNKKYVLSVASMVERKGLHYLIRAFPTISERIPESELLLIGEGYYKKQLQYLAKELGLQNKVHFIPDSDTKPRIPDEGLPFYYNAADVFVLPSLIEGLGVVGIEAMACETPFVGTNVDGIPSLVEAFETGVLIPPMDPSAIAAAVIDTLESDNNHTTNRDRAKRCYDWPSIVQKNIDVYNALFERYYGGCE